MSIKAIHPRNPFHGVGAVRYTTLIVPGFHGSGPAHWQTWLEARVPGSRRVTGIDWEAPVLARWSAAIGMAIEAAPRPVWLVAHSFGCLASVVAGNAHAGKIAGALLVAPADPERFSPFGPRDGSAPSVAANLPRIALPFPSLMVTSDNDPWLRPEVAAFWANRWGSDVINLGAVGHINVDSGFGPWPQGLALLEGLQRAGWRSFGAAPAKPFARVPAANAALAAGGDYGVLQYVI